jgi:hypothetical protein
MECVRLITGTLALTVAPVIGTVPSNRSSPLKNAYVRVTALECTGVMRYARGAKSWPTASELTGKRAVISKRFKTLAKRPHSWPGFNVPSHLNPLDRYGRKVVLLLGTM